MGCRRELAIAVVEVSAIAARMKLMYAFNAKKSTVYLATL